MTADPFDGLSEVGLHPTLDLPFAGGLELEGPGDRIVGRLVRSEPGADAGRSRFVLQDGSGRTLYSLQAPISPGGRARLRVVDPSGAIVGELATFGLFRTGKSLVRDGRPLLHASTVSWSPRGFDIRSGPVRVASVSVHRPPLRPLKDARGVTLHFAPVAPPVPRSLLVAFAAILALWKTPPAWLAFDEP